MVALGLLSQKPPPAGMVYAPVLKTGLLNAVLPAILNVPLVMVRKPAVLAVWTVIGPLGVKVRTVPVVLLSVTPVVCRRLVVLPTFVVKAASVAPVKVICAPARLPFVLKLSVPLFIRSVPTVSMWAV